MNQPRVVERANGTGRLGAVLKECLRPYVLPILAEMPFAEQISFVYKPAWGARKPSPLARAALSYLAADVPIQVAIPYHSLCFLIDRTAPLDDVPPILGRPNIMVKRDFAEKAFPYKPQRQSVTKVNVYLDEVGRDLWSIDRNFCYEVVPYLRILSAAGIYNDQATSFLLYAFCLRKFGKLGTRFAASVTLNPDYGKEFSNFIKALGSNSTSFGALLTESDTLQGRGVGGLNLPKEASQRCKSSFLQREMLAEFPDDVLESAVGRILDLELRKSDGRVDIEFPSLESHWDSRWEWAVNGSHSALVDKNLRPDHPKHPDIERFHRRAWLEDVQDDPRLGWDGTTYVSVSPKLEHGKTRAIYACDTVNYLAFEHLMGSVEKVWRGNRVILNPGKGGHLGMAERVAKARDRSGVSLMLDYDDFNSHHTTRAMQIVLRMVCDRCNYPRQLRDTLINSLDKETIYVGGKRIGHCKGTLMSGHRCTTFFNSVLNMAYLLIVLGEDFVLDRPSLHVGDDVYMGARNYQEAGYIIDTVMSSRLRMNPRKQSVGHVSTEFLRVASGGRYSYGYLARAVSSIVSGNWVSESSLDGFEALNSMVSSARTLANRGQDSVVPLLLKSAVRRTLPANCLDDSTLCELLSGTLAINNGPVYSSGGRYRYVQITPEYVRKDSYGRAPLQLNATHSFLSKCATPLESEVLTRSGISVVSDMERSSYSKTLKFSVGFITNLSVSSINSVECVGSARAEDLLRSPLPRGVLTQFPLLTLAKARIPEHVVRDAVAAAGGNPHAIDLQLEAWGEYKHGCVVNSVISHADASALGKRTRVGVLTSTRWCYV